MTWVELVQALLSGGFLAALGAVVVAWMNRRKPRADMLTTITMTSKELIESLREEVRHQDGRIEKQGAKIKCLEARQDATDFEMRAMEEYVDQAVPWIDGADAKLREHEIPYPNPPRWNGPKTHE